MRLRVKLINDTIKLEQKLTVEDVDEQLSELRNQAMIEGRDIHPFEEITDILEFVPRAMKSRATTMMTTSPPAVTSAAEDIADLPDVEEVDKDMEKNLRWDDEDEPAEEGANEEGGDSEGGGKASGKSGRRGR
jgi:hypothetical protein